LTTERLLSILAERGLQVLLNDRGLPILRGPRLAATPKLLRVLRHPCHRQALVQRLLGRRLREFLWRTGYREKEWAVDKPDWFPVGVLWWRYVGDTTWQPVPGCNLDNYPLPTGV
jgi:hypothetical protein